MSKRSTLGATTSVMTCSSLFSPSRLATTPATRCASVMPSTSSYFMWPHSTSAMTYSSKSIANASSSSPPIWHVANAPCVSRNERLECTSGSSAPLTAAFGRSVISLVTPLSKRSVQKASCDIESSCPAALLGVASCAKCLLSFGRRGLRLASTAGSLDTIFLILTKASSLALFSRFFCSITSKQSGSGCAGATRSSSSLRGLAREKASCTTASKNSCSSNAWSPALPSSVKSARANTACTRAIGNAFVASPQSSTRSTSSVCSIVSRHPDSAVPLLE
eukprot:scaffold2843_cov59-Phaeocystis_antarctica.AAC.1